MKSKGKSWGVLLIIICMIAACAFVTVNGSDSKHTGSAQNIKLGLDLAGGVSITYEADTEDPSQEDMSDTVYKLQQRVEAYSTEAEVYQQGSNRINVDIPGVYNAEEILEALGNPGTISFCEAVETTDADGNKKTDYQEVVNGDGIASAGVGTQQDTYGNNEYVIELMFSDTGKEAFAEATARNIGKPIYIFYDGEMISYPTVNSAITDGQCVIEGNYTYESANALATTIRAGKLKLSLNEIQSKVVGAKLGDQAISTSLQAGLIGFVIVILFMLLFYRISGLAASIALALYLVSMMCFLNGLDVTLTLPGIAGIILSIGMAVDANVIIFTRIREEITAGRDVLNAIKIGFKKALSAIIDGNVTTLIAALVLYLRGSGTIKGFAITLALGIILSMFTALVITQITSLALYGIGFKDKKFYGEQKPAKVLNYMGMRKATYPLAIALICAGFIAMGVHSSQGNKILNYSLDFTGGTSMTVTFNEAMEIPGADEEAIRTLFSDAAGVTDVQLQNVTGSNDVIIKTPVLDSDQRGEVKDALETQYSVADGAITEENISGVVSGEMRTDAVLAVIIAAICIVIYIWIRFRDFKFGLSSILALLHDVLIVLMVYAVVRISVGTTFIACMLTIVGYSINATIVVFDRIRENKATMVKATTEEVVNASISQTLSRSINTSFTTFIMVFMLYIMGVTSIKEFALPLLAGIIAGGFSSIFISGTLWCTVASKDKKKK